ncbi:MAG: glycine--tRNA ligase subunit beta [Coriobacteriia bacterium]|nr:glycine--tRNA ligase subunit beta [Coriobacteriia bacterium]
MAKHVLAFEVGTEEIPAFDLVGAEKQLASMVPERLKAARIPFDSIEIHTTPRRLIVLVNGVEDTTPAQNEEFKGPKAAIAFDADGNPTKAAMGFARGKGLTVDACERRVVDGDEYLFAVRSIPAQDVRELLPDILAGLIPDLKWPRSMRWGARTVTFSRPVRYLLALLDDEVLPVAYSDMTAGRLTAGHPVLSRGMHEVARSTELLDVLRANFVVPNMAEREAAIRAGVAAIEAETGSRAELPEKTLTEVINLSEYPQALRAVFDEEFLLVPEEIIVDAMLMHQRYFPLYDAAGKLTNDFIIVSNGDPAYAQNIIAGNERVVRARLDDAKFFYEEDLKKPLEAYVDKLDQVVFQEKLGTVRDKAMRLVKLAGALAEDAQLGEQDAADLKRAALLCKADLVTNAVIEFTSVQGVMGSYYATAHGETEQVARAIGQHYQPRFAGDALPDGTVGQLTAFADKVDTICGLFAVGQGPTGSKDPFALRRQAIGIVNMLVEGLPVSLEKAIDASLDTYENVEFDRAKTREEVIDFFVTRTKVILKDGGAAADVIDAILAAGVVEPAVISSRVKALGAIREELPEDMDDLATAYARANNLRDADLGSDVDAAALTGVRADLLSAVNAAQGQVEAALDAADYTAAVKALAALRAPIDTFFDDVKVMADDAAEREQNLKLLNAFVGVFAKVADFGKMAKKK